MQRSALRWISLLAGLLLLMPGLKAQAALDSVQARYLRDQREIEARQAAEAAAAAESEGITAEEEPDESGYSSEQAYEEDSWNGFTPEAYANKRARQSYQNRTFDAQKLKDYRGKRTYQYDAIQKAQTESQKKVHQKSGWDAFWKQVRSYLGSRKFWDWVVYGIIALMAAFLFRVAFRMSPVSLFRRVPHKLDQAAEQPDRGEEELIRTDFEDPIRKAVDAGDYRLAVRLLYLDSLRTLARQGSIRWRRDKTNYEYLAEIASPEVRKTFAALTRRYEYSWYGEFPLSSEEYHALATDFSGFKTAALAERRIPA